MSSEIHEGSLETAAAAAPVYKKTWREKRWERRRRRRAAEEVLGWVLVPLMVIGLFWGVKSGLGALGTSPTALIQGVKTVMGQ
jgi:hypothetical protein